MSSSSSRHAGVSLGPARHNLSAAPAGGALGQQGLRPIVLPASSADATSPNSAQSTSRSGAGGETDRAFAALKAAASPKTGPRTIVVTTPSGSPTPLVSLDLDSAISNNNALQSPAGALPSIPSFIAASPSPSSSTGGAPSLSRKASVSQSPAAEHTGALLSSPLPAAIASSPVSARKAIKLTESKEQHMPHPPHNHRFERNKRIELEEEIITQKTLILKKDEYIAGLQRNCETLSALCAKHMQQVTLLKVDFDRVTLEKHMLDTDNAKSASNATLAATLLKENEDLQSSKKALASRFELVQTKLHAFQHQLSELTDQKADLVADLARERMSANGLKQELDEMRTILNSDTSASTKKATSHQHVAETKLLQLKKEHEANRAALETLGNAHKAMQLAHTRAQNMATRLEQEKTVLEADVARWKKLANTCRKEAADATDVATVAQEQHVQLSEANERLTRENAALVRRVPELETALKTSERSRDKLKREHEQLWSTKQDLVLQLDESNAEATLLKKQLDILKSAPAPTVDNSAEGEVALLLAERSTIGEQLVKLQTAHESLEELLRANEASLSRWQSKYEVANTERVDLARQVEEAAVEAARLNAELKAAGAGQKGAEGLQQSLTNATAALAALQKVSTGQGAELDTARADAAKQAADLATARTALSEQTSAHARELADMRGKSEAFVSGRIGDLEKQLSAMQKRLLESQHANAELSAILDGAPKLSAGDLAKLARREQELKDTVAKLVVNEEASEASFTCFACVGIFNNPITCIPCGHSYCRLCIEKTQTCSQCSPPVKVTYYANELLSELASRFVFRKQALQTLKEMTAQPAVFK